MPLSPEQLVALDEPPGPAPNDLLGTRTGRVMLYVLMVNAAAGTGSMRARRLAQRLAGELGYPDPLAGKPAVAIEPALIELERALDTTAAPVAEVDTWG